MTGREARETLDAEDYMALLHAYAGIVDAMVRDNLYSEALDSLAADLSAAREDHEATTKRLRERRDENYALETELSAARARENQLKEAARALLIGAVIPRPSDPTMHIRGEATVDAAKLAELIRVLAALSAVGDGE